MMNGFQVWQNVIFFKFHVKIVNDSCFSDKFLLFVLNTLYVLYRSLVNYCILYCIYSIHPVYIQKKFSELLYTILYKHPVCI